MQKQDFVAMLATAKEIMKYYEVSLLREKTGLKLVNAIICCLDHLELPELVWLILGSANFDLKFLPNTSSKVDMMDILVRMRESLLEHEQLGRFPAEVEEYYV